MNENSQSWKEFSIYWTILPSHTLTADTPTQRNSSFFWLHDIRYSEILLYVLPTCKTIKNSTNSTNSKTWLKQKFVWEIVLRLESCGTRKYGVTKIAISARAYSIDIITLIFKTAILYFQARSRSGSFFPVPREILGISTRPIRLRQFTLLYLIIFVTNRQKRRFKTLTRFNDLQSCSKKYFDGGSLVPR